MAAKPTITLTKISYNAALSEETNAYSAHLHVDGVLWGQVSNHGHGGCDIFHGVKGKDWDDIQALDALIAKTYPVVDMTDVGSDEPVPQSLEGLCGEIVDTFILTKAVRRQLARTLLYFENGVPADGETASLWASKAKPSPELIARLKLKHPSVAILNELPIDEAVTAYRKGRG